MSVLGKQIKKYRIAKGITQEQLGELIGVTTQAVSRWECGGTPDAELLPSLSKVLNVSIDALFGDEEQNMSVTLARQLCKLSCDEAFRFAFGICWAIEIGLVQDSAALGDFLEAFIEHTALNSDKTNYYAKIVRDEGIATVRLSPDMHHFFLMSEPEKGIREQLADPETLCRVFRIFADEKLMKIIFYMYSRLNTPIATSLISKNTGIDPDETDKRMETLCENNLATCTVIATTDGEINSYMFNQESAVIPLLCYADEIARTDYRDFICCFGRTKPLM